MNATLWLIAKLQCFTEGMYGYATKGCSELEAVAEFSVELPPRVVMESTEGEGVVEQNAGGSRCWFPVIEAEDVFGEIL